MAARPHSPKVAHHLDALAPGPLALLLLALAGVALLDATALVTTGMEEAPPPYIAFIDGGSTGSRLHIFKVARRPGEALTITPCAPPRKVNTPLATLAGKTAQEAALALHPLLSAAQNVIPAAHHATTPLFVWGTAGMRGLAPAPQRLVYDALHTAAVAVAGFEANRSHFRTISGQDEGFYGWLAANYIHGVNVPAALGAPMPPTVGSLDVGGASAQAVFLPATSNWFSSLTDLRAALFVRSYRGCGAHLLDLRLKTALARAAAESAPTVDNPCSFPGTRETVGSQVLVGTGNFAECLRLVRHHLKAKAEDEGTPLALPEGAVQQSFWGMSLLFHATHFLSFVVPSLPFPRPSIEDLVAAGDTLCATDWPAMQVYVGKDPNTPASRMFGRCFDVALTVALLGEEVGWGFPPTSRQVLMVQNVSQMEVEWSLGAALTVAADRQMNGARLAQARRGHGRSLAVLAVVVLLAFAAYGGACARPPRWPFSPRLPRRGPSAI